MVSNSHWPTVAVVCIGTELTTGHVKDSNAHFIARTLTDAGCGVVSITFVPDAMETMVLAMQKAMGSAEWTIVTGGLGPTDDDFTKEALLRIFGGELRIDSQTLRMIEQRLQARGVALTERNRGQAAVPSSCTPLLNHWGCAPGMLFRQGDRTLVSLPGVPSELEPLLTQNLLPIMREQYGSLHFAETSFNVYGVAESLLAERLEAFEANLTPAFSLAYLPGSHRLVELRLRSAHPMDGNDTEQLFAKHCQTLRQLLGDMIFSEGEESLSEVVHGQLMRLQPLTLSTAESCTSGELAAALTAHAGSSRYFSGAVVAYSNQAKEGLLGVDAGLIVRRGAVSEEVARAMAQGAQRQLGSNIAISTTGLLGPDGDGTSTPVGTLYVAIHDAQGNSECHSTTLTGSRLYARQSATLFALNALRLYLGKRS